MRLGLRLILPLLLAVTAFSFFLSSYQVKRSRQILERELSRRAELLADSLEEEIVPALGYDTEEIAGAIYTALEMDSREQKARMQRMRRVVKENNIYRWAATLIGDLCDTKVEGNVREEAKALAAAP